MLNLFGNVTVSHQQLVVLQYYLQNILPLGIADECKPLVISCTTDKLCDRWYIAGKKKKERKKKLCY